MERDLEIKLKIDRSQAKRENQAFAGEAKRLEKEILDDARAAELAKVELIRQANREKIKAAVDAANAGKIAADRATKDAADAQRKAVADARQAARDRAAAEKQAAAEIADASRKVADAHKQTNMEAAGAIQAISGYAGQIVGLNSVSAVISTIVDNFKLAKQSAYDAGKMVQDYRLALLELAALKGQLGGTTQTLSQEVQFRAQTLQTAADAQAFQKSALGMGQAAIGNQISQAEFNKAMVAGGSFQAAEGGSATTHGQLVGMIPTLMGRSLNGRQMTADEIRQKEQQFYQISQPGGADFGPMMEQFLKNSQLSTTGLITPERNLALQSAFSTTNREGAGNMVQQFARATVGGMNRMRGMPGVPGDENEKLAIYLRGLGATDQMDPIEIGKLISADLSKQEKAAEAGGKKFNAMSYLQRHGQANMEDTQAILAFHGLQTSGQLDKTFLSLAEKVPTVAEANAPVERFQRTDPAAQTRKSEMAGELSNLERVAFERLKARGETYGKFDEKEMDRWDLDATELIYGYRKKMDMEAQAMLAGEARKLGIDAGVEYDTNAKTGERTPRFMGREKLYELGGKINAAGGESIPGLKELTESAGKSLDEAKRFEGQPLPTVNAPDAAAAKVPGPVTANTPDNKEMVVVLTQIRDRLPERRVGPVIQTRPVVDTRMG
jgi:hypothetical protein